MGENKRDRETEREGERARNKEEKRERERESEDESGRERTFVCLQAGVPVCLTAKGRERVL